MVFFINCNSYKIDAKSVNIKEKTTIEMINSYVNNWQKRQFCDTTFRR